MSNTIDRIKQKFIKCLPDQDILVFTILLIIFDLYLRFYCGFNISKFSILFNIMYIFIIDAILILIRNKIRMFIELLFGLLLSIFTFAQAIHYNFFITFFRFKKLKVISELNAVMGEVFTKVDLMSLVIFMFYISFIVYIVFLLIRKKVVYKRLILLPVVLIVLSLLINIFIHFYLTKYDDAKGIHSDTYLRDTFYNNSKYADRFGLYDYIFNDFASLFKQKREPDKQIIEDIANYIQNNNKQVVNEYTGIYKGKNLIMIQCESLNNYPFIEGLTPTLIKMRDEGIYFNNYYAPVYPSATSDAEFIALTSMLPSITDGNTCYTYPDNLYKYALPYLFKQNDYNANSYHANYVQFYNRGVFHESLGFHTMFDNEKMNLPFGEYYQEYLNWIPDSDAFDGMMNNTDIESGKPFFDFAITLSGHIPYVDFREEIQDDLKFINDHKEYDYMSKETKAYVAANMSLDRGLNVLFKRLEQAGILNDTIIVLFGDHYPYGIEDTKAQQEVWEQGYQLYRVPLIIYDPSNPKGELNTNLVSSFDIYPTICNMFGLDYSNEFVIGKDVFEDDHTVIFSDRSILTNDFYYDSSSDNVEWFVEKDDGKFESIVNDVNTIFKYGEDILLYNYYGYLENNK